MLAQDSNMSEPVQYDPNTGVSYYPWEEAEIGAVNSYNLTNMATMSNPFSQVMAPTFDARPEEVVESKTNDTQIQLGLLDYQQLYQWGINTTNLNSKNKERYIWQE